MNSLDPNLAIVFFTSTKGHHKCKTLYKKTLAQFSSITPQISLFVHIKVSPGEELIAKEMENWILQFYPYAYITQTVGVWSHVDGSSHHEYLKDIDTNFQQAQKNNYKYALFLEDDWLFNNDIDIEKEIANALDFLIIHSNFFCYRWVRSGDSDIIQRTEAKQLTTYGGANLFSHTKEFSFNPCIVRIAEFSMVARFCNYFYPNLHPHCEMAVTNVINFLLPNSIFLFHDRPTITHIGTQEFIKTNHDTI